MRGSTSPKRRTGRNRGSLRALGIFGLGVGHVKRRGVPGQRVHRPPPQREVPELRNSETGSSVGLTSRENLDPGL